MAYDLGKKPKNKKLNLYNTLKFTKHHHFHFFPFSLTDNLV